MNFEAMACGRVLLAYDQGEEENRALGFVHMENLVLYKDLAELRAKLALLRSDPARAERIAGNARALAEAHYRFEQIGAEVVQVLSPPLRDRPLARGWLAGLRERWGL